MRIHRIFGIFLLLLIQSVYSAITQVMVSGEKAELFKTESMEKVVYTAKTGEKLSVISQKGELALLRSANGKEGWAKKSLVKPVEKGKGESFVMDEAKVLGFLENPQAVYILDNTDPNFKPIKLDRSFNDNLVGNVDKETNQRINDAGLKPEK